MDDPSCFLASEFRPSPADAAAFHVISAPLERTVSYGAGTALGPAAILQASLQLEAGLDGVTPGAAGIHTQPTIDFAGLSGSEAVSAIAQAVGRALDADAFPLVLGGEHTVTAGAARAFLDRGRSIGVVQFDAHADLRDAYEGSRWSHACVGRRVRDWGLPLFQIGVRSLCAEEEDYRIAAGVGHVDAREWQTSGIPEPLLPAKFPREIYISFDIDAFDASLMPATGTPGGLLWWDAVRFLRSACTGRRVVGADVVELAPVPGLHHCEYTAAKLAYLLMGLHCG
jgi:agmatinase